MKIALLRKRYTFHGGAEGFSQGMAERLAARGHDVHLYAIRWDGEQPTGNIHVHAVPAMTFSSLLRDLTFALNVRRMLRHETYDIIQSHDKTLYQDIYRAGDGCHKEWLRQRWSRSGLFGRVSVVMNPYHWLILGLERSIFSSRRYRRIIAISELVRRNLIDNYRVPERDIAVIYNGVDLDRFHPDNRGRFREGIRRQYDIPDDAFVALFVGSGFERKGVRFLLEAAEQVALPVTVLIVGKGNADRYAAISRRQRVIFCGPQQRIERYYAAADAFVFPTIYEPFGNVQLEAMASGLPVITTRNSGASEIIDHGRNGFVADAPEAIDAIAGGLSALLDSSRCTAMGKEARKTAELFTFDRYLREILELYSAIMEEKSTAKASSS